VARQRDVEPAPPQVEVRVVVGGLGGLADPLGQPGGRGEVVGREPGPESAEHQPPVVESGIGHLLSGQLLLGIAHVASLA
jgi:hypothetical protein